jgi:hypothetical protein
VFFAEGAYHEHIMARSCLFACFISETSWWISMILVFWGGGLVFYTRSCQANLILVYAGSVLLILYMKFKSNFIIFLKNDSLYEKLV